MTKQQRVAHWVVVSHDDIISHAMVSWSWRHGLGGDKGSGLHAQDALADDEAFKSLTLDPTESTSC